MLLLATVPLALGGFGTSILLFLLWMVVASVSLVVRPDLQVPIASALAEARSVS